MGEDTCSRLIIAHGKIIKSKVQSVRLIRIIIVRGFSPRRLFRPWGVMYVRDALADRGLKRGRWWRDLMAGGDGGSRWSEVRYDQPSWYPQPPDSDWVSNENSSLLTRREFRSFFVINTDRKSRQEVSEIRWLVGQQKYLIIRSSELGVLRDHHSPRRSGVAKIRCWVCRLRVCWRESQAKAGRAEKISGATRCCGDAASRAVYLPFRPHGGSSSR